jgi:hypothetical protein
VASLEPKVASLEPKVASLEPKVASLEPKVASLEPKVASHKPRVVTIKIPNNEYKLEIINICSDSNYCISFGLETEKIKTFFNDFRNFDDVEIKNIKRIGENSKNGFITFIPFKKKNLEVSTVLKSSIKNNSDNLIYEGLVGGYLNEKSKLFPCFIETYAYGTYGDKTLYDKLFNERKISRNLLNTLNLKEVSLTKNELKNIGNSCKNSKYHCILVENLQNIITIDYIIDNGMMNYHNFVNFIFQVYCPLDKLHNNYTHYDLHSLNVCVYFTSTNKYVNMKYHYKDETIEFKTNGITKIIDYGRSFFHMNKDVNSKVIHDIICNTSICNPNCGVNKGYIWEDTFYHSYHINPSKRNVSHDLRLLNIIKKYTKSDTPEKIQEAKNGPSIKNILNKLVYTPNGTPEIEKGGYPNTLLNVTDAHLFLKDAIKSPNFKQLNDDVFKDWTLMGTLDIWVDENRPMEYISFIDQ